MDKTRQHAVRWKMTGRPSRLPKDSRGCPYEQRGGICSAAGLALVLLVLPPALVGCGGSGSESAEASLRDAAEGGPVSQATDNYFSLQPVTDAALAEFFTKQVDVFGVQIAGTETTPDYKVLHAANVMAQYLDNDEDGTPDNQAVVDAMVENRALLVMFADFDELENSGIFASDVFDGRAGNVRREADLVAVVEDRRVHGELRLRALLAEEA